MLARVVVLGLVAAAALVAGQDLPSTDCAQVDAGGLSSVCTDKEFPYCMQTGDDVYRCRACATDCDCPFMQYCTRRPGEQGVCRSFEKFGKPCRPMDPSLYTQKDIDDEWKCAETYSENNNLVVDHAGFCSEGVCQFCTPNTYTCFPGSGTKEERFCVAPGVDWHAHEATWASGFYQRNPVHVWMGICFFIFLLIFICQIVQVIFTFKTGGGGGGGSTTTLHEAS